MLTQIQEILRVHSTALSNIPYESEDECHVDAVLGSIIQPLLQSCRLGGQSGAPDADTAIFMLNNVSSVQVTSLEIREGGRQSLCH